jgi:hypothetical protein
MQVKDQKINPVKIPAKLPKELALFQNKPNNI